MVRFPDSDDNDVMLDTSSISDESITDSYVKRNSRCVAQLSASVVGVLLLLAGINAVRARHNGTPWLHGTITPRALHHVEFCFGNPMVPSGLKACCQDTMITGEISSVRNTYDGNVSCGYLVCPSGEYQKSTCGQVFPAKVPAAKIRFWFKQKQPTMKEKTLAQKHPRVHTGRIHHCKSNPFTNISSCCALIYQRTSNRGIFQLRNMYADNVTCGLLNCHSGRFLQYPCPRLPRTWRTSSHLGQIDAELRTLTDAKVAGPLGSNKGLAGSDGKDQQGVFPAPADMASVQTIGGTKLDQPLTHELAQGEADNSLTEAGKEKLADFHETAAKQRDQAMCAGYISSAILYLAPLAININSINWYCIQGSTTANNIDSGDVKNKAESGNQFGPAQCARAFESIISDISWIAFYATSAAGVCGDPSKSDPCGETITNLLGTAANMAKYGTQLQVVHNSPMYHYYSGPQAGRSGSSTYRMGVYISAIAGNVAQLLQDFSEATRVCAPGNGNKADSAPKPDYAACIGNVVASTLYIAGAALNLEGHDDDYYDHGELGSVSQGLNSLALAANQADSAAQTCGGPDQACGEDITQITSSLFAMITAISTAKTVCSNDALDAPERFPNFQARCTNSVGQAITYASAMAQTGASAAVDCGDTIFANNAQCGAAVSGIMAAFASLIGGIGSTANLCPSPYPYFCAEFSLTTIAGAAMSMCDSFADAVAFCPFTDPEGGGGQNPYDDAQIPFEERATFFQNTRR